MALLPVLLDMVDEIYGSLENPSNNFSDIPLLLVPQRSCPRKAGGGRHGCPKSGRAGCSKEGATEEIKHCQKAVPSEVHGECPMNKSEKKKECSRNKGEEKTECPIDVQGFGQFFSPEVLKQYGEMFSKYHQGMTQKGCPSKRAEGKACKAEAGQKKECPFSGAAGKCHRHEKESSPSSSSEDECQKKKCPCSANAGHLSGRRFPHQHPEMFGHCRREMSKHGCPSFSGRREMIEKCRREMSKHGCPCVSSEGFKVTLDVKSFKPEEIIVKVKGHEITVNGQHEEREDEFGLVSQKFTRRYILPNEFDPDTISTHLSADGKLTIKAIKPKPVGDNSERVIPIQRVDSEEEVEKNEPSKTDENALPTTSDAAAAVTDGHGSPKGFVVIEDGEEEPNLD